MSVLALNNWGWVWTALANTLADARVQGFVPLFLEKKIVLILLLCPQAHERFEIHYQ